jgi:hypothetical protein
MHVNEHCKGPRRGKTGSLWMCSCGKVFVRKYRVYDTFTHKYWDFVGYLADEAQVKERAAMSDANYDE